MNLKSLVIRKVLKDYLVPDWARKKKRSKAILWTAAGVGAVLAARALTKKIMEYDLRGKNVLITGGSRGLGLVMAREFLREGARVAICARDPEELERAYDDLMKYGSTVFTVTCDVTDQTQVFGMVQTIKNLYGDIDVLVNNAGTISVGPIEEMTLDDYEKAMNTNYWSALYCILAVMPNMRRRRDGRIVNITSIGGKISVPHLVPYSASKFALVGLSSGLNAELKKDQVIVTTVVPGLMRTGSPRNANFKGQHRAEYSWFVISDSSPLTSISAESAARQIIAACKRGDAEIVLSPQAKVAVKFASWFPGLTADCLSLVSRLLPAPGGIGTQTAKGRESASEIAPSVLTTLDEKAARENNQIH
ncbi:MAG: SDR family NAD(P)-dependent oxidoreductase [Acidobacteriota bacterium]